MDWRYILSIEKNSEIILMWSAKRRDNSNTGETLVPRTKVVSSVRGRKAGDNVEDDEFVFQVMCSVFLH